jgi:hypothetical protein
MVIVVPLVIAVAVTLWSLEQVRYRPKRRPRWASQQSECAHAVDGQRESRLDQPAGH